MPAQTLPPPASRQAKTEAVGLPSRMARLLLARRRFGPTLLGEALVFWFILLAFQFLGYGGRPGGVNGPTWYLLLTFLIAYLAMAAGETRFRLHRRVWTVAGINDAFAVGLAVLEATFLVGLANFMMPEGFRPYRLLTPLLAAPAVVIAVGAFRLLPRLLSSTPREGSRMLVVVPDAAAYSTVKVLLQHANPDWVPIAIATLTPGDRGRTVMGLPVVGSAGALPRWIQETHAEGVAFVLRGPSTQQHRDLFAICLAAGLPIFIVPEADKWFPGRSGVPLRQLSADDLVGRTQRDIEIKASAEVVHGKTVLVTGAAGSIGSELCRMLAGLSPRRLVLLDINESGIFDLAEELRTNSSVVVREALVSIVDSDQLRSVFAEERPEIVFHCAAYKHVPMLESHPVQAVMTNVVGTWNTLRCAEASAVERFVLISTDKAVARHSVMGCTKRLCEEIVLGHQGSTLCWAVRFGNVVGSRGSVVPLFERQIEQGGPVTITHPDVSRFMMTIREAVLLVVRTLPMGESGHLYMLDMGPPIKILDLAHALIRSRGMRPGSDIEIVFSGLRPGELMSEELLASDEGVRPTTDPSIMDVVAPYIPSESDLAWTIERIQTLAMEGRSDELVRTLKKAVRNMGRPQDEPAVPKRPQRERLSET
jgi:FlaA1/EpsC-like NDP-sugar epimerase